MMKNILIGNGLLVTPFEERFCDLWTDGAYIAGLGNPPGSNFLLVDARGCFVTPGLFDLQVNGGPQCDFWGDPSVADILAFGNHLLSKGVTAILPTLITAKLSHLCRNRDFLKTNFAVGKRERSPKSPIYMPGIHLEGPCCTRAGVHPKEFLQPLNLSVLKELVDESVKLVTLAPELDPSGECLRYLTSKNVLMALGHSNASFEEAQLSFDQGIRVITHTFNALPSVHHRQPGAVTAALLDKRVSCCLICDGLHLNPAIVSLAICCKGIDGTVLVTDSAHIGTSQGGLVGSSIVLSEAVANVVNWGIASFAQAIKMASYNPARLLGLENLVGNLKPGAFADIVLWDRETLKIRQVIFNGKVVYPAT